MRRRLRGFGIRALKRPAIVERSLRDGVFGDDVWCDECFGGQECPGYVRWFGTRADGNVRPLDFGKDGEGVRCLSLNPTRVSHPSFSVTNDEKEVHLLHRVAIAHE